MDMANHMTIEDQIEIDIIPKSFDQILVKVDKERNRISELSSKALCKKQGYYQEQEVFTLSVDNNQHNEIYPNPYYNYQPIYLNQQHQSVKDRMKSKQILNIPDDTLEKVQKYSAIDEYSKVWDLSDDSIFVRLVKMKNAPKIHAYEEVKITYGEHSNGYLLQEYGFTTKDNPFDFVRKNGITIDSIIGSLEGIDPQVTVRYQQFLNAINLK